MIRRQGRDWPYNLFCMLHGRDRQAVLDNVDFLVERCGLQHLQYKVLFSRRRYKQRGARYRVAAEAAVTPPLAAGTP